MTTGRIEYVDLREIWGHEAHDFTPFLAENLDLLGDTLGMELVLLDQEHQVGEFSLDLLAETEDGLRVAIENQLEQTNHRHLGQIITYMAGVDAHYGVLLVKSFREEHRAALDWLNHNIAESIGFFGVEVQAIKIGDSPPAPHFKIVSSPNEWGKVDKTSQAERDTRYGSFVGKLSAALAGSRYKIRRVGRDYFSIRTAVKGCLLYTSDAADE